MKKLFPFILTLALLLTIACGCNGAGNDPEITNRTDTNQTDAPQTDGSTQPDTNQSEAPPEEPEEPEIVPYGTCGDNLNWELTDNGVLTISGTGAMKYDAQP